MIAGNTPTHVSPALDQGFKRTSQVVYLETALCKSQTIKVIGQRRLALTAESGDLRAFPTLSQVSSMDFSPQHCDPLPVGLLMLCLYSARLHLCSPQVRSQRT